MSRRPLFSASSACLVVLLGSTWMARAGAAAPAEPDLSGFRTVETATKTQLMPGKPGPAVQVGYLGIHVTPDKRGRPVIEAVEADSPAAQAGLEAGDVLVRLEADPTVNAEGLRQHLRSRAPGDVVRFGVERKGSRLEVAAVLGATSRPKKLASERAAVGLALGEAMDDGAPIQRILSGSPADRAGLRVGEVVTKVDGVPVNGAASLGDTIAEKEPGDTLSLTVRRDGKELDIRIRLAPATSGFRGGPGREGREGRGGEGRGLWKQPVYRLAVIGIEYPDVKHNPAIPASEWEQSLFSSGVYHSRNNVTGQPVHGSLNDLYKEMSCGAFRVEGKVFDWVEVGKKRGDYSQGTGTGGPNRSSLLTDALDALLARDGREALSAFDGIFFLYAGERFPTSRGGIYWPHRASVNHQTRRWPYFICPEGGRQMASISVFCHEFGHMLGLPDLYARPENPGSEGLGAWCLMSNQVGGGRPQHMSAWCKEQLGWLKPAVIDPTVPQKLVLAPIESSTTECFKVLIRRDGSEYLLVENRRKKGFDGSLPAEGLLIWRIVGGRPILEESHGVDGPPGPGTFLTSVPYPSGSNNAYTPYTTPSSRSQLGGGLPVFLTNIRQLPDGRVTFFLGYEFQ